MKVIDLLNVLTDATWDAEVIITDTRSGVTDELTGASYKTFFAEDHSEVGPIEGLVEDGDNVVELFVG